MTKNVKELLPIGSVVRLNGAKKALMIYGLCQTSLTNSKTYDYIGVVWPMGNLGEKTQVLFNHAEVEEVLFTGFHNAEREAFMEKLEAFYAAQQ